MCTRHPGQRQYYAAPLRGLEPKAGHNQALTIKTILGRILPNETPRHPTQPPNETPPTPNEPPKHPTRTPNETPRHPTQTPDETPDKTPRPPTQTPDKTPRHPTQTPDKPPRPPTHTPDNIPNPQSPRRSPTNLDRWRAGRAMLGQRITSGAPSPGLPEPERPLGF
jgi:hypothetical protein